MYRQYQRYRALTISGPFRGTRSLCEGTRGKRQEAASSKRVSRCYRAHKEGRSAAVRCYASARTPVNATTFGRRMTALNFERKKVGGSMRYEGIAVRGARPELTVIDSARTSSVA
jgi:hypothetical protein